MSDYKDLKVWQKSHALALACHKVSSTIRGSQNASLRSQLVRAAFSVPANIVEGNGVQSRKEFARFVRTAINSNLEQEYHITTAGDLNFIKDAEKQELIKNVTEVRKMLHGLLSYLDRSDSSA